MDLQFPVEVENLCFSQKEVGNIVAPRLSYSYMQVDEDDFVLDIHNVASYRVQKGKEVCICPHKNSDIASIRLFLNGSVLAAVLHQQHLLPFHGSSLIYDNMGVIICGHAGIGKSSVALALCQNGGQFINDDITPVRIGQSGPTIMPIKTHIKLWDDSLQKLNIEYDHLERIRPTINKFYLPAQKYFSMETPLNQIFILGTHNENEFNVTELKGMEKFDKLRKQIYRKSYLKGMPETRKSYFKQILQIIESVRVTVVTRPQLCDIYDTMKCIQKELAK